MFLLINKLLLIPRRSFSFFRKLYFKYKFGEFHYNSTIVSPLHIVGFRNIYIGENVRVQNLSWLQSSPLTGFLKSELRIGNNTTIGHFNHIVATKSIVIGNNVLTADKVYISDNIHGYKDVTIPIKQQPIVQKKSVKIGDNSWIGENVCIIGACVGKHCVIGANSVVTKDIPDYSVVVGSPARIIKKYNFDKKQWIDVDRNN